jgi:ankyrin repeat protein
MEEVLKDHYNASAGDTATKLYYPSKSSTLTLSVTAYEKNLVNDLESLNDVNAWLYLALTMTEQQFDQFFSKKKADDLSNFLNLSMKSHSWIAVRLLSKDYFHLPKDSLALFDAIESGDVALVKMLIKKGDNLKKYSDEHGSPIQYARKLKKPLVIEALIQADDGKKHHFYGEDQQISLAYAAKQGWNGVVAALIKKAGCNVNQQDSDGCTALYHAVKAGNFPLVKLLLEAGVDVRKRYRNDGGCTVFAIAAARGYVKIAAKLQEHDKGLADIATPIKCSPLYLAVSNRHIEMVDFLLDVIDHQKIKKQFGRKLIDKAIYNDNPTLLAKLIDRGYPFDRLNSSDQLPLVIYATRKGWVDVLQALVCLKPRININEKDRQGKTALHYAAELGSHEIIKILLNNGADPGVLSRNGNILHLASKSGSSEVYDMVVKALSESHSYLMYASNADGKTPLHYAAISGNVDRIKNLIDSGNKVNIKDNDHKSALYYAALNNHADVVKWLVEQGASFEDIEIKGFPLLTYAIQQRWGAVVDAILMSPTPYNIDKRDCYSFPPVYYAVAWEMPDILKKLIEKGANINQKFNAKKDGTLMHRAAQSVNADCLHVLIEAHKENALESMVFHDKSGNNPLHYAANSGRGSNVAVLAKEFPHMVNAVNRSNETPLNMIKSGDGAIKVEQLLLEAGAKVDFKYFPTYRLHDYCSYYGYKKDQDLYQRFRQLFNACQDNQVKDSFLQSSSMSSKKERFHVARVLLVNAKIDDLERCPQLHLIVDVLGFELFCTELKIDSYANSALRLFAASEASKLEWLKRKGKATNNDHHRAETIRVGLKNFDTDIIAAALRIPRDQPKNTYFWSKHKHEPLRDVPNSLKSYLSTQSWMSTTQPPLALTVK